MSEWPGRGCKIFRQFVHWWINCTDDSLSIVGEVYGAYNDAEYGIRGEIMIFYLSPRLMNC